MKFGLTLPNRGVLFGVTTAEQMLQMAEIADRSEVFQSVWVGDSLLGKPRMESIALLAGVAARTKRCGSARPAWRASRCAIRCCSPTSGPASTCWPRGGRSWSPAPASCRRRAAGSRASCTARHRDRVQRLIEWITLIKRLWTEDDVTFEGKHYRCERDHHRAEAGRQAPPADLDRQQRAGRPGADRADPPAGRPPRRRLADLDLGSRRRALAARRTSARACARAGPRPGRDRDAPLPQHQRQRGPAGGARRVEAVPGHCTTRPTSRRRGRRAGSPPVAGGVRRAPAAYQEMGFDEVTLRITGWDQFGQLRVTGRRAGASGTCRARPERAGRCARQGCTGTGLRRRPEGDQAERVRRPFARGGQLGPPARARARADGPRNGVVFPLVHASAEAVPLPGC